MEVFVHGDVVFSLYLYGSRVVEGLGRESWRGGLGGFVSLKVYPSPYFPLYFFRAGGGGLKFSEKEE